MAVDKIWVFAESAEGKATSATLELLTKARELASTVEAIYTGSDTDAVAASVGEYGATKLFVIDPATVCPARSRRRRSRSSRASTSPTRFSSRRATTAATRSRACR